MSEILSSIIENTKYAKFDMDLQRRETWNEICNRNMNMHLEKFKDEPIQFKDEIKRIYNEYVFTKKVLFSMRSAQFAGKSIEISPNRIYNCAYMPIDSFSAFSDWGSFICYFRHKYVLSIPSESFYAISNVI